SEGSAAYSDPVRRFLAAQHPAQYPELACRGREVNGYAEVGTYNYVWVNDGGWHTSSPEQKAMDQAMVAAQRENKWDAVYDAERTVIDTLPCDEPKHHRGHLCKHLQVSFWRKETDGDGPSQVPGT